MDAIAAIEDTLRSLVDSWNLGDAEAFAEVFAPDAEYTTGAGQSIRGRARIAGLVARGAKVAVVDGPSVECGGLRATGRLAWAAVANQGGAARSGIITCTLARHGGSWLIERLRNEETGESPGSRTRE
jgi:uncharacterized protein (TIGR02246 family)